MKTCLLIGQIIAFCLFTLVGSSCSDEKEMPVGPTISHDFLVLERGILIEGSSKGEFFNYNIPSSLESIEIQIVSWGISDFSLMTADEEASKDINPSDVIDIEVLPCLISKDDKSSTSCPVFDTQKIDSSTTANRYVQTIKVSKKEGYVEGTTLKIRLVSAKDYCYWDTTDIYITL